MKNTKVHFITFADSQYRKALRRIKGQAKQSGFFDCIAIHTERSLPYTFLTKHKYILNNYTRGFGYWIWKPKTLIEYMEICDDGDVLVYADAGFHINGTGKIKFSGYLDSLSSSSDGLILLTTGSDLVAQRFDDTSYPVYLNIEYTKSRLLNEFGLQNDDDFLYSPQFMAGLILLKVTESNKILVRCWLDYCEKYSCALINDESAGCDEFSAFKAHRHDQSILNCVIRKLDVSPLGLSYYETWPGYPLQGKDFNWKRLSNSPFQARRDTQRYKIDALKTKTKVLCHNFFT